MPVARVAFKLYRDVNIRTKQYNNVLEIHTLFNTLKIWYPSPIIRTNNTSRFVKMLFWGWG